MALRHPADSPLIALDAKAGVPLYRQLYEQYRQAILTGRLRANSQLPPTRELAEALGVSRNTVLNAFAQLVAEGYLRGTVGSGTFVNELHQGPGGSAAETRASEQEPALSWEAQRALPYFVLPVPDKISPFWSGVPALDQFPAEVWTRLLARRARKLKPSDLHYGDPAGLPRLRELIAQYLRAFRAVRCDADQIVIVSGSQQALYLSARVLLNREDLVAIEDPGYPGARRALTASGARLVPIPLDEEGVRVGDPALSNPQIKAIYVTPSHQMPLGMTMSLQRRLQLLEWSARQGAWILEDDFDSEYRYASKPLSSLQGLDTQERVLYLGTFSKLMFPALRLGFMVLPRRLVRAFCLTRQVLDICPPTLNQAVMADFMEQGHFVRHIRRMKKIHWERQTAMLAALRSEFGEDIEVANVDSGLNLILWLPPGVSDVEVSRKAWEAGVFTFPMSSIFYISVPPRNGLFLGFGGFPVPQIRRGVKKLKEALMRTKPKRTGFSSLH